jgi:hypothetical protein
LQRYEWQTITAWHGIITFKPWYVVGNLSEGLGEYYHVIKVTDGIGNYHIILLAHFIIVVSVPDPGKGVCADPVNGAAILGKGGPEFKGGNKERQLSPDKGREKT